jgi:hypothetical protein
LVDDGRNHLGVAVDGGEAYPEQVGRLALFILCATAPTCLLGRKLS